MAKVNFLREAQLARLRQNIRVNGKRYSEDEPWLASYFGAEQWALQSSIEAETPSLAIPRSKDDLLDLENTRTLYDALRHLTPLQAADERLWSYMTHVTFWDYMRKRWPAEQYQGKISVRSERGKFCEFTLDFPENEELPQAVNE